MANRVWQYHFGRGLVDTPSNLGESGSRPTHPELLDWLACELRDNGGRLKPLHKRIVLSRTYQQDSAFRANAARTDPENKGAGGISAFLVERDTDGLSFGKPYKKMGQQGAPVCDVIFDNCRIPASALIGPEEGQGFKTAMKVLDRGRLTISASCIGNAERLVRDCLSYAMDRKQFGKPISDFQLVQAMLADCETEIYAAKSMVLDAARRKDAGENITKLAAICKYYCSEMVGRVADRAVQIHGGAGYIADYGIERFYRDVRLYRLYEGTSQVQQLIIAREMLKEAAG